MNEDCIFCKIITKQIPSEIVYEDEETFAFLDIKPINPGHTLIVPKKHSRSILEIDSGSLSATTKTLRTLAPLIKNVVGADGMNVHINCEPAGGQVVFHTHIHLIPRHEQDGYEHWHGKESASEDRLALAEKIKAAQK